MATGQVLFQRFFYTKSFVKHSMEVSVLPRVFPAEIHRGKTWAAVGGLLRGARTCLLAGVLYLRGWGAPGTRVASWKRPLRGCPRSLLCRAVEAAEGLGGRNPPVCAMLTFQHVSMACVHLASKIEEAPRRIRDVINVFHRLRHLREKK